MMLRKRNAATSIQKSNPAPLFHGEAQPLWHGYHSYDRYFLRHKRHTSHTLTVWRGQPHCDTTALTGFVMRTHLNFAPGSSQIHAQKLLSTSAGIAPAYKPLADPNPACLQWSASTATVLWTLKPPYKLLR
jgi:hypothetical protein